MKILKHCLIASVCLVCCSMNAQDAKEIVQKADEKFRGSTNKSTMTMTIVRPTWERSVKMKSWTKGQDYMMILIVSPAKDKGQAFLKREKNLWNWQPRINRMIKLPPSMMSQGWMGSDITNDDIMRQSSLETDYNHRMLGLESISGKECHKIELIPHDDANVVWGKIIMWVSKEGYLILKSEYYDEEQYLVHTETGKEIKVMGGREIASVLEIVPVEEEGNKTILRFDAIEFDAPIEDSFFSQQKMKQLR